MAQRAIPGVVFQPHTHEGLQRGINQIVAAIRPTLGPHPRSIAVENVFRDKTPELLDDAALIARRIIQLPDRDADAGAMLLRHVLWRVHEEAGDGAATAALIFHAVYNQGLRYIAAGGNAMYLRRALEGALETIIEDLNAQTLPLAGRERIAQLAESICYDAPLAALLGEIFDIVGEHGQVDVGTSRGRELERHYVEGMYWPGGVLSPHMLSDPLAQRTDLTEAAILISDLELSEPRQLAPLLDAAMGEKEKGGGLVIVAQKISESVIATLLAASREPERFRAIAVRTPGLGLAEQAAAMEDLALLTGGRPLITAAGDTLRGFRPADLGRARRAWADRRNFGVIGGKGNPRALRQHIARLRAAFAAADDAQQRTRLQQRIGKLLGGSASLAIGGSSEPEILAREKLARRTVALVRAALREGVLPGGGIALLACRARLRERLASAQAAEEQVACRILLQALEEPARTIAANAGFEASAVMAQLERAAPGHGFDARTGAIVDMARAGIYDVAAAHKTAVRAAVTGAATALTVDVLVHKRNPESTAGKP